MESDNAVFLINSLEGGGAERIMVNMLSILEPYFSRKNMRVYLVLLDDLPEEHSCPGYVHKIVLNSQGSLLKGYSQLSNTLCNLNPKFCLSFLTRSNVLNVVLGKWLGYPAIISERVHTSSHLSGGLKDSITKQLVKLTYKYAKRVIGVAEGVKSDLVEHYSVPSGKISVLYNPYNIPRLQKLAEEHVTDLPSANYIVGIGRLVKNKNFSLLIKSFAKANLSLHLVILGAGEEEAPLKELTSQLGAKDKVHFIGFKANPYPYIANATFFVSTSNAEGFPNAIVEAMCLGKPVVATNCESGPAEIIAERYPYEVTTMSIEKNGILCPMNNQAAVTDALNVMCSPENFDHFQQQSLACAKRFSYAFFEERVTTILEKVENHV